MIRNVRNRALKRLYEKGDRSKVNPTYADKIENILSVLDNATKPEDLDLPGIAFHTLTGDRAGYYTVTVGANWRIIFEFDNEPKNVDLVDYH